MKINMHSVFGFLSLFIAAIGLSGFVYETDLTSRVIWCAIWVLIAWFWFSQKIQIGK